jgi:hypothetical protein
MPQIKMYSILKKIAEVLKLDGFPDLVIGVPKSALTGAHPAWYIDLPDEDYEYGALQPVYKTKTYAVTRIFIIVHVDDMPQQPSESMAEWLEDVLIPNTVTQFEEAARARTFPLAVNCEISVTNVKPDWRPDSPLAVIRFDLELRAYGD